VSGGLTYLFTDVEGSTRLIQELGSVYGLALQTNRHILTSCVEANDGQVIRGDEGDGSFFVFSRPGDAITAAVESQRRIQANEIAGVSIRVRAGLHTGPAVLYGGEHVGINVHIAARVCAAASGGQILCTGATAAAAGELGDRVLLKDLGSFVLRGISEPHTLVQVCSEDLPDQFPSPRGGLREGGAQVSVWRRHRAAELISPTIPEKLDVSSTDGGPLPLDLRVEIGPASEGPVGAFRLLVIVGNLVEEAFDGLTIGGINDAASIVNAHSSLITLRS
jgi:class 3 adenylate cyclase